MDKGRRLASRLLAISIPVLLALVILMTIVQHRYDKILNPVFYALVATVIASHLYLQIVEPKAAAQADDAWLLETVRYYRDLDFFRQYRDLSDRELVRKLKKLRKEEFDEASFPMDRLADLWVLSLDKDRVFWGDLEADVWAGNEAYVDTLKAFARISRGVFTPTDITETWETEKGPVRVEFAYKGERHCLQPKYGDDWLDAQVLFGLDRLIADSGYHFGFYDTGGTDLVVVTLTPEEKRKIKRERGVAF